MLLLFLFLFVRADYKLIFLFFFDRRKDVDVFGLCESSVPSEAVSCLLFLTALLLAFLSGSASVINLREKQLGSLIDTLVPVNHHGLKRSEILLYPVSVLFRIPFQIALFDDLLVSTRVIPLSDTMSKRQDDVLEQEVHVHCSEKANRGDEYLAELTATLLVWNPVAKAHQ